MDQRTVILASALAISLVAFVLSLVSFRRLSSTRRSLVLLQGQFDGDTLVDAVASYVARVRSMNSDLDLLRQRQEDLFAALAASNRHVGLVRYDAFEDMGGLMSFSAAFLDDHESGIVLTAINGRTEARIYAKTLEGGKASRSLSPEEQRAVAEALGRRTKVGR